MERREKREDSFSLNTTIQSRNMNGEKREERREKREDSFSLNTTIQSRNMNGEKREERREKYYTN